MTQKSQVDKVLDTENLLVFVVSVWLFFFYLGTLYLFMVAHHRTGWRKLGIQILGGDSNENVDWHASPCWLAWLTAMARTLSSLSLLHFVQCIVSMYANSLFCSPAHSYTSVTKKGRPNEDNDKSLRVRWIGIRHFVVPLLRLFSSIKFTAADSGSDKVY